MVAMLVVKNKNISILMKIHDFMKILGNEFLMYWPQTWPPCHVVAIQVKNTTLYTNQWNGTRGLPWLTIANRASVQIQERWFRRALRWHVTLGTRGFSRLRREFSVLAEATCAHERRVTIKTWQKPETALEKSPAPRVMICFPNERKKKIKQRLCTD